MIPKAASRCFECPESGGCPKGGHPRPRRNATRHGASSFLLSVPATATGRAADLVSVKGETWRSDVFRAKACGSGSTHTVKSSGSADRISIKIRPMSGRSMAKNMPKNAAGQLRKARLWKRTGTTGQLCVKITARRDEQERRSRKRETSRLAREGLVQPQQSPIKPFGIPARRSPARGRRGPLRRLPRSRG